VVPALFTQGAPGRYFHSSETDRFAPIAPCDVERAGHSHLCGRGCHDSRISALRASSLRSNDGSLAAHGRRRLLGSVRAWECQTPADTFVAELPP
jgi:hypothetical protein